MRKLLTSALAVAVLAGGISAVLATTAPPASALTGDDKNVANWNMQGGNEGMESKWTTHVRALTNNNNVIALQEAGSAPQSAQLVGQTTHDVDFPVNADGTGGMANMIYTVNHYRWRIGTATRGATWHIYWLETDPRGGRVNLAMVTDREPDTVVVAPPAWAGARPALGLHFGNNFDPDDPQDYYWSVHALSGGGGDSHRLLANIAAASRGQTPTGEQWIGEWVAMGDWNHTPAELRSRNGRTLPSWMRIYAAGQQTQRSGRELDYLVSSDPIANYTPTVVPLTGDHDAVIYRPLQANADIHLMSASNDNAEIAVIDGPREEDEVVSVGPDAADAPDDTWYLVQDPKIGWYLVKSKLNGGCWDAGQAQLMVKPCNGTSEQGFYLDYWRDSGQTKIQPARGNCVGEDPNNSGLGSPILTTVACNKGEARWNTRFDRDPGAGSAPIRHVELRELVPTTYTVAADGSGQFRSVQAAIDAVPADGSASTISIGKGTYTEVITVPTGMTNLTIKGATGNPADVVIRYDRAHGYLKPDGTKYSTQGSAVASFKAANLRVEALTIQNTFDSKAHPEINQYETQAVALLAMGDRQVYNNVRIISTQDTVYAKGPAPTDQVRQYFRNSYIAGNVDFLFGNATAVFDRATVHMWPRVGGTILAPNTEQAKKYGFLITNSTVISSAPANTFYLGRPWHNTATASPQVVIRNTVLPAGVTVAQPWTNMVPDYTWQQARLREYRNTGPGASVNGNRPQLTDAQAGDYTAQKYLAGTDGWNPVW